MRQVFRVERRVVQPATGLVRQVTVYGLTSLLPHRATARQVARYVRHHWRIENRSHWVRDAVFQEDSGRVRTVPIPQGLAALRNALIGLLHAAGHTRIKAASQDFQANPWDALRLLGFYPDN